MTFEKCNKQYKQVSEAWRIKKIYKLERGRAKLREQPSDTEEHQQKLAK